jgi:hypothetical protein
MPHRVLTAVLILLIFAASGCDRTDSRIVNKPFGELEWIERTRSPIALAMAQRHYLYCSYFRNAYKKASDEFASAKEKYESGQDADIGELFALKRLSKVYSDDLISNLWEVIYYKPDHRRGLYELIDMLEERWYTEADEGAGIEAEAANLAELEKALRIGSNFFGRDYELNYKLGAVLFSEGSMLKHYPELAAASGSDVTAEGKFTDAEVFLRKCIAVRSMYAEGYELLALSLEELGRDKEAYKFWKLITVIERAYKREPSYQRDEAREQVYEMARGKVADYEAEFGPT